LEAVILKDDLTYQSWWKLAKVIDLVEGQDGLVRAVKIQILSEDKVTTLCRPIQQLIPLEVSENQ